MFAAGGDGENDQVMPLPSEDKPQAVSIFMTWDRFRSTDFLDSGYNGYGQGNLGDRLSSSEFELFQVSLRVGSDETKRV